MTIWNFFQLKGMTIFMQVVNAETTSLTSVNHNIIVLLENIIQTGHPLGTEEGDNFKVHKAMKIRSSDCQMFCIGQLKCLCYI
mmetsp:Transcript_12577/g.15955  ORF Transcript_12577/g.15955 Transcript_12577/m.15955 type:complete len:83 (+) Transcript_12577:698-946(+)